ncbi:thymidylate synthase, partial [Guyparkeria sp. 1SP6A2]|nr:thymidylate synthase [Guyparkeria sp. 1SP6A2]
ARAPMAPPALVLNPAVTDLFDFTFEDIHIEGYQSHPHIKAKVAV